MDVSVTDCKEMRDWISEIGSKIVEVDIKVNSLYFRIIEESDNSWTSDTDSGVMLESTSVGAIKCEVIVKVDV